MQYGASNGRDPSAISPIVQQFYQRTERNGSNSEPAIRERDKKKFLLKEDETACPSGCGPNSPISWICEKQKKNQGKRDFQQTQGSLSNDSAMDQNSSHSRSVCRHKDERDNVSVSQSNGFHSTFPAANMSQTNGQANSNPRSVGGNPARNQCKPPQDQPYFSSQNSSSKAHQFLRDDSDEEYFNTQSEALIVENPETASQLGINITKVFTQPRQPAKQQMPLNSQNGRISSYSKQKFATDELLNKKIEEIQNNANMIAQGQEIYHGGPYINISHLEGMSGNNDTLKPYVGESRIVAPNVSKLSPNSAVEVRIQSSKDAVIVLCSVDVLKMRSGYFHKILTEQESQTMNQGPILTATSSSASNILWRETIFIPEESPFEAAAFLESLHEGRTLFRGEWNYCWARLSVSWMVEDLMLEYVAQIDQMMQKIVATVDQNHWRTNPNILSGMRICIFRKGSNPSPTIVSGFVVESPGTIGYSKVRVAFDNSNSSNAFGLPQQWMAERTPQRPSSHDFTGNSTAAMTSSQKSALSPRIGAHTTNTPQASQTMNLLHPPSSPQPPLSQVSATISNALGTPSTSAMILNHQIVGDVTEPFWVQSTTNSEYSQWADPDDLFNSDSKRLITLTDKRIFWEMARALIDLPEISAACKGPVRTVQDVITMLKRLEYRFLWTSEAADIFPHFAASELIRFAFANNTLGQSKDGNSANSQQNGTIMS